MYSSESVSSQIAAWVEAIGAIAAVIGAGWVAASGSRATRRREERSEAAVLRKEERTALATRTAALNLAILASIQITDLHVQLKNEAWRGRATRVSASRALLTTERMPTAFPLQSLGNASAMVEFSRFPASLAIACEACANLETAVRAAAEVNRDTIFGQYNKQMERLDESTKHQFDVLRQSLNLELKDKAGHHG
jgi:hypothetical protein